MEKERKDTADKLLIKKNVRINNDYHYFPSLLTKDDYSDCDKYIKQLINSYDIELNDKIIAVDNDINLKIFTENKNLNEQPRFSFETNNIELVKKIDFYCRRQVIN